jgi:PAT family beta-lactamase induction signal transducer AmpG
VRGRVVCGGWVGLLRALGVSVEIRGLRVNVRDSFICMNEIETVGAEAVATAPVGPPRRGERPWLYGFLIAPSAVIANGVVQGGVLSFLLSQQGIGSGPQSHLLVLLGLPTWLYFLWSPMTDFFVKRRTWLMAGAVISGVLMALAFRQNHLLSPLSETLMLLSACCSQLVVSSCGGMMGAIKSVQSRRSAGSFYQAGSMGLGAVSAAVLIRESSRVTPATLGLIAAAMIGIPALMALFAPKQEEIETGSFVEAMKRVGVEAKATFWRWEALPYIACMTFPMASGSAVGLLPGVAGKYGVGGDSVAWMNGLMGGVLMAAGSATMAWVKVRARATVLYMIVGLINCAALGVLWLGPATPTTYLIGVVLYLFTVGSCYAMFTAVVLEFLGASGKSGSTRYSIINSLGNVPVLYMIRLDGWGGDRFGARGLSGAECVVGAVGASVLLIWFMTTKSGGKTKRLPDVVEA